MWNDVTEYARAFTTLLAVIDPIGAAPLFLAFTRNIPHKRRRTARVAATVTGAMLIAGALAGEVILRFFGVSPDAFRVTGGVLFMLMALDMLRAKQDRMRHTPKEDAEAIESDDVAVTPLAFPLLAGPGAISATIFYGNRMQGVVDKAAICAICAILALLVWATLVFAPILEKKLSQTSINVGTRIMGLILAAMAVEFIVGGMRNLFPGLAG
ncbi:MAG: MarC family protein [Rickettsiales bacterium]